MNTFIVVILLIPLHKKLLSIGCGICIEMVRDLRNLQGDQKSLGFCGSVLSSSRSKLCFWKKSITFMIDESVDFVGEPMSRREGVLSSTRKGLKECKLESSAACEKQKARISYS